MILYHGSYLEVQKPDLLHSRENVDFGRGFYTTPLYDQAVKWCENSSVVAKKELFLVTSLMKRLIRNLRF